MPYYLVKDFVRGLDVRRMIETSEPGSLIRAKNCVITRGGEIERRKAWNLAIALPADTFGLWYEPGIPGTWHVWGSAAPPVMPAHVTYHQLVHPDGLAMTGVRCVREFNKRFFVIAQFSDNSILAYYNDRLVVENNIPVTPDPGDPDPPDPPDPEPFPIGQGRATASFKIVRTTLTAADLTAIVAFRSGINPYDWEFQYPYPPESPVISILATDSAAQIATKIADAVNSMAVSQHFHASAVDDQVLISFEAQGEEWNGWLLTIPKSLPGNQFTLDPTLPVFSGGQNVATSTLDGIVRGLDPHAVSDHWSPGQYAIQHKGKMFAVAGDSGLLNVSALNAPDIWTPDATGAGFIDMSQQSAGRSTLVSLAQFQGKLAVFATNAVYIWYMDPDLAASSEVSVLDNTGAIAPRSVLSYGNSDAFYLSFSGIRSLQSRDVNGEAFASDIGNPIDDLVRQAIVDASFFSFFADAAIDPLSGRYVLAFSNRMFVFNFFSQTKISAWTEWDVGFPCTDLISGGTTLMARTADAIYIYGRMPSIGADLLYDDCEVEVQLPYLAAGKPAHPKAFFGLDVAAENDWLVEIGTDYTDPDFLQPVGNLAGTTFREQRVGLSIYSTHVSFRLTCTAPGYARIGSLAFHFNEGEEAG